MLKMKILLILTIVILPLKSFTQKKTKNYYSADSSNISLLSAEEKETLNYINLMRRNPVAFYKTYLIPYIKSNTRLTGYYTTSLKKEMLSRTSLDPFSVSPIMKKTADYQAKDLAQFKGKRLSHTSSTGNTFEKRMQQAGVNCAGENLYTGENRSPLEMIMDLLIDEGVKSLGHRKALLSIQYKSIGISIKYYSAGGKIMVQDFSCQ